MTHRFHPLEAEPIQRMLAEADASHGEFDYDVSLCLRKRVLITIAETEKPIGFIGTIRKGHRDEDVKRIEQACLLRNAG